MRSSLWLHAIWVSFTGAALALSCGSDDAMSAAKGASGSGGGCITPDCLPPVDAAGDAVVSDVTHPDYDATPTVEHSVLCGSGCGKTPLGEPAWPEDAIACSEANAAGGAGGAATIWGCGVVRDTKGEPRTECVATGTTPLGDPCVSTAACARGLACVGEGAGKCHRYCCGDPEDCPTGTYCTARPLLDGQKRAPEDPLLVPVCAAGRECRLDEPYPCPSGTTCSCPAKTACTVVRGDGTLGCVTPGTGEEGDPCPCAASSATGLGFVCSQATNTCLRLCSLSAATSSCGPGSKCQSSAALPAGFGTCSAAVGTDAWR